MQRVVLFPLVLVALICSALMTHAHVVVHPREARAGSYETFSVRCPNEKDKATLKVELEIPDKDVAIHHYETKPGWKIALEKNTSGDATKITWTAEDGTPGLLPDQFVEFRIMGKIGKEAKSIVWKAHQTYAGDDIVAWTGEPGTKTPASVTKLNAASAGTSSSSHAESHDATSSSSSSAGTNDRAAAQSKIAFNLALGALILSAVALLSGFLRKP